MRASLTPASTTAVMTACARVHLAAGGHLADQRTCQHLLGSWDQQPACGRVHQVRLCVGSRMEGDKEMVRERSGREGGRSVEGAEREEGTRVQSYFLLRMSSLG
eukprot:353696-Chlamydomonas_euryale.AAC.3